MTTPVPYPRRSPGRRAGAALVALATASGVLLAAPAPAQAAPNTVEGYQKWYLDLLDVRAAQQISTGKGVVIGLVDDTVSSGVAELKGKLLPGHGVGTDVEPDGTGDDTAHGTGMASIIAGSGGKGRVLGIAPGVKILPASNGRNNDYAEVIANIRWAVDHGADVINLSLGADRDPGPEEVAVIQYALSKDVVVVAAAGNTADHFTHVGSWASVPGVVAVTGIEQSGKFCSCSMKGDVAALSAPAKDIIAPYPPGFPEKGYNLGVGTSPSAAIVSAVAAMVRSKYPGLNAPNVVNRLITTARDQGPSGRDPEYGFGVVDPVAALTADVPAVQANPLGVPVPQSTRDPSLDEDVPLLSGSAVVAIAVVAGLVLLAVVVLVILLVVLSRRRRRRAQAATAAAQQWQQPQATGPWHPPHG